MTTSSTRRFFWIGTVLFTLVFIGLTVHTHTTISERTHDENLTESVKRGALVWGEYNCENCHTLMGEGAYYAPDLTNIVEQRGETYLTQFMKEPSRFYSQEEDGRLMPDLELSEREIQDVLAFLEWVGQIDLNGWPPRPILVAGVSVRGMPGVEARADAGDADERGKAVFQGKGGCASCHSLSPGVTLVGASLAKIGERADERVESPDYTGDAETAEGYLRESVLEPNAYVVPGERFATGDGRSLMPGHYGEQLSQEEVDDLVAFLETLR